ncbi:hypothetical protein Mtc_0194 [Methanocella conradii HZ254]|uniref:Uncharacterized protein n=1 Tax=Methanocella conradii (strain DSM 24694 / JCM 17849 / CGMCC 1.5162 / HZ254) TaxID=1041930 RepID=H8I8B2_METCZ|nr:hypothetical protein [Methanocella conradii]AFC98965.1 hypothetical protein Mtc_0194 [Methanocella conradii HZ254]
MMSDERWKHVVAYVLAISLCCVLLTLTMSLWQADLSVPFDYSGDALLAQMAVKGLIENGWYLHNGFLGAPMGQDLYDFPMGDTLDLLIMKLIVLFTGNYAVVTNLFFLLTFPLTTLTAMLAFRQLKLSYALSIVGGLLFTFLPYHFYRGEAHLFLSSYFIVPLVVLVCLWLYKGAIFFRPSEDGKVRLSLGDPITLAALGICLMASLTMAYYVFFSCFFLLVAGIAASVTRRSRYPLLACAILIAMIVLVYCATMMPSLLYQLANGINPYVGVRSAFETEVYGLKIDQLLMPISGHRIGFLASIKDKYDATAPLVNENAYVALGAIGSIGFILLMGWAFYRLLGGRFGSAFTDMLDVLSAMNLSAVLLATVGGFGALFAVIYPQFRAINRISVFIAFFSLLALLIAIQLLSNMYLKADHGRLIFAGTLILVLAVGVWDQTSPEFVPQYSSIKAQYWSDDAFIKEVEAAVPPGSMIFQMPYIEFPEYSEYFPQLYGIQDYDLFKGYLHSTSLHWSFGAIKGRGGDEWEKNISSMPLEDMVKMLSLAGFDGIYVDSYGYPKNDTTLTDDLSKILKTGPIVSPDGRLYFFSMKGYNERLKANYTAEALASMQKAAFDPAARVQVISRPLTLEWRSGFAVLEGNLSDNWRWCPQEGELYVVNPSREDINVTMRMWLTALNGPAELHMDSDLFNNSIVIDGHTPFEKTFVVPHGRHIVKFTYYGPESTDSRAFKLENFTLTY